MKPNSARWTATALLFLFLWLVPTQIVGAPTWALGYYFFGTWIAAIAASAYLAFTSGRPKE